MPPGLISACVLLPMDSAGAYVGCVNGCERVTQRTSRGGSARRVRVGPGGGGRGSWGGDWDGARPAAHPRGCTPPPPAVSRVRSSGPSGRGRRLGPQTYARPARWTLASSGRTPGRGDPRLSCWTVELRWIESQTATAQFTLASNTVRDHPQWHVHNNSLTTLATWRLSRGVTLVSRCTRVIPSFQSLFEKCLEREVAVRHANPGCVPKHSRTTTWATGGHCCVATPVRPGLANYIGFHVTTWHDRGHATARFL